MVKERWGSSGAKQVVLLVLALAAIAALQPRWAYAIADPDTLLIESTRAYQSVLETGDLLVVVKYNAAYTSLPTETITESFVGRFLVGGSEVNSVEPVAFNNRGWGKGVFSFYWTAAEATSDSIEFDNTNSETYEVILQGKPSTFSDPPKVVASGIQWRDATDTEANLKADIQAHAESLENDAAWAANSADLIGRLVSEIALTNQGEDYFGRAIPNLSSMTPDLFSSSLQTPDFREREFGNSTQEGLDAIWTGTPVDTAFISISTDLRVPKSVVTTFVAFGLMVTISFFIGSRFNAPRWGLLTLPFTFGLFIVVGFIPFVVGGIVGLISAILLGFTYFLRRAF